MQKELFDNIETEKSKTVVKCDSIDAFLEYVDYLDRVEERAGDAKKLKTLRSKN